MVILSDRVVTTKKTHTCSACGRTIPIGAKMRRQVNIYDGLQTWKACKTCDKLLENYRDVFESDYYIVEEDCVLNALRDGDTPEDLLKELEYQDEVKRGICNEYKNITSKKH